MKGMTKRKIAVCAVALLLCAGTASAQFGVGIVYDPTNYHNALLRYYQLQQHLLQLQRTYTQVLAQYNLALADGPQHPEHARALPGPVRRSGETRFAHNTYGNTGIVGDRDQLRQLPMITAGYQQATTPLLPYNGQVLADMNARRTRTRRNRSTPRSNSPTASTAIPCTPSAPFAPTRRPSKTRLANLEQDSFSGDPNLNTEVSVLNKINAANMLTLRTVQDSNKLLASLLEQQTIARQAAARGHHQHHQRRYHPARQTSPATSPRSPAP